MKNYKIHYRWKTKFMVEPLSSILIFQAQNKKDVKKMTFEFFNNARLPSGRKVELVSIDKIEESNLTLEQQECQHEWLFSSYKDIRVILYCPKCKLKKQVLRREWDKTQIDQVYQER